MKVFVAERQPWVAIAVVLGGALAMLGTALPWAHLQTFDSTFRMVGVTINGFDFGYVTGSIRDGNDGILILLLILGVILLGAHYYFGGDLLAAIAVFAFAATVTSVAAYDIVRLHGEVGFAWTCGEDSCVGRHSWALARAGLYLIVSGGLVATVAALFGLRGIVVRRTASRT